MLFLKRCKQNKLQIIDRHIQYIAKINKEMHIMCCREVRDCNTKRQAVLGNTYLDKDAANKQTYKVISRVSSHRSY